MKYGTGVLCLVAILIVAICILSPMGKVSADTTTAVIKPALGDLDLRSPTGEQVSLIPYIGRKAVVVVFWATWCPICKKEVPHLNRLNSNPLVKVIGVNEGESLGKIRDFIVSNRIAYEVVVDPKATVAKSFGVPGMPYCVIIGKTGVIDYRGSGLPENLDLYLNQ
jgi:peroxiredoxin